MSSFSDISEPNLTLLLSLIQERLGLDYSDGKIDLLKDKLAPLAMEHGFNSFLDYIYLLRYSPEAENEWRRVETALAVNETYFWREYDQVKTAVQVLVPRLLQSHPGQPVRIWHAGCATGEEPYSLALSLVEAGLLPYQPVEIYASDMNAAAIARARGAVYRPRSLRNLPPSLLIKYFTPIHNGEYQLNSSIRSLVRFSRGNLFLQENLQSIPPCDIIFCRNVFIYFTDYAIKKVSEEFYQKLITPGYLFLGSAETLFRIQTNFEFCELDGSLFYFKTGQGERACPSKERNDYKNGSSTGC